MDARAGIDLKKVLGKNINMKINYYTPEVFNHSAREPRFQVNTCFFPQILLFSRLLIKGRNGVEI